MSTTSPERFRSSDVQVVKGYHVTCMVCGEDVADYDGHGLPTRAEADDARQHHIRQHRAAGPERVPTW